MTIIKWNLFEKMLIDNVKTIDNIKSGLLELEDMGFTVTVKWIGYKEILVSIHDPKNREGRTRYSVSIFNSSIIKDYITTTEDYCEDCLFNYSYKIYGTGNKNIEKTTIFPENEDLIYFKLKIILNLV